MVLPGGRKWQMIYPFLNAIPTSIKTVPAISRVEHFYCQSDKSQRGQ